MGQQRSLGVGRGQLGSPKTSEVARGQSRSQLTTKRQKRSCHRGKMRTQRRWGVQLNHRGQLRSQCIRSVSPASSQDTEVRSKH